MKTLFTTLCACTALGATSAIAGLAAYDAKIAADNTGGLPYISLSDMALTFDTTNSEPFDFGAVSESSTIEFILFGDPVDGGQDAYLAVGANGTWNLRYEQWDDTGMLGFTHLGVADYVFDAPVPAGPSPESPTELTHVTYRWDQETTTMELYLDGELAGTNNAAAAYEMPTGMGLLGNNAGVTEGMLGVIERVTGYNEAISPDDILAHANAWLGSDMMEPFVITEITYSAGAEPDTAVVDLTWNSRPNVTYIIDTSNDLTGWDELDDSYPSGGESTSLADIIPNASMVPRRYYRVTESE